MHTCVTTVSEKQSTILSEVKTWLSIEDCEDDELLERQIIPYALVLLEECSGQASGCLEVVQTWYGWPESGDIRFAREPVIEVCSFECDNGDGWEAADLDELVEVDLCDGSLRPKCDCCCKNLCPSCCPVKWRLTYRAGGSSLPKLHLMFVKLIVAEAYRVREASLETRFFETPAYVRLYQKIRRYNYARAI